MTPDIPRIRMFAGPNGSGKSTIKSVLKPELVGWYVNPDEIEDEIARTRFFEIQRFGIASSAADFSQFFLNSSLVRKVGLASEVDNIAIVDGRMHFKNVAVNSYLAAVLADFVRQQLINRRESFTFETVMSSSDKVTLLESSRRLGYRTYLYYVATDDPVINIARVKSRLLSGGHSVPEEKIVSRYARSLELLTDAIRHSSRAYVFDNSAEHPVWIAEFTEGRLAALKAELLPKWFEKAVLQKLQNSPRSEQ